MAAVFAAKQKKFAILGAGRLGQSTAAHFAMNGLETALWDPETERIEAIRSKGNTIKLSGVVEGEGRLSAVSSSLQEVAESSEVLIMCAGGFAQEEFARQLCPHLKPWHHVILFPGDTFGALSVRQIFDVYDASYAQITVSETSSALFTCNLVENGTCEIKAVKTNIPFATIPASRTAEVLDCLRPYYTQFAPVQSVLETSLNNMHAVANPVVALMNAARAESGQAFRLFREGVTPAVAAVMDRVDQERRALCGAAGVQGVPLAAWLHEAYDLPLESLDRMYRGAGQYDDVGQGAALAFIHEDICAGLVPMASLGQLLGVPTPTMDGLLQLARAAFPELQERLAAGRRVRTVRSVGLCMAQVPGSSSASARRERLDRYLLTGDRDDLGKEQVLVVGSGAAAHVLAGLLAAREDLAVSVWAPDPKDARRWQDELEADGRLRVVAPNGRVTVGRPRCVSADPAAVAPAASKVLLALPGAAQPAALAALAPHLAEGAWLGCLGGPGAAFEWEAGRVVGEHAGRFTVAPAGDVFTEKVVLFGVAASPWLARVAKFACEVRVVGRQSAALVGVVPAARGAEVAAWLGAKLGDGGGVHWEAAGHALAVTLAPVHQVIVPGLLYARFKDWGGEAFDEIPLLYSGTTHEEAAVVEKLGEECNAVAARLEAALGVPLPEARAPLLEALCRRCFPEAVEDDATLRAALLSNRAWAHTRTPMRCAPEGGGFVPDLAGPGGALAEAAAGGLAALKGLAELAGAETPTLDQVLEWCQAQVGKEYLVGGGGGGGGAGGALRLLGRDALSARVPARYGLGDLDALRRRVAP